MLRGTSWRHVLWLMALLLAFAIAFEVLRRAAPGTGAIWPLVALTLVLLGRLAYASFLSTERSRLSWSFPLGRSSVHLLHDQVLDLAALPGHELGMLRALVEALEFEHGGLYRRTAEGVWHWLADTRGPDSPAERILREAPWSGGMPLVRHFDLGMPLMGREGIVGLLVLSRGPHARKPTVQEQEALNHLCGLLATRLETQHLGHTVVGRERDARLADDERSLHDRVNAVVSHQLKTPLLLGQGMISDALSALDDRGRVSRRLDKVAAALSRFERNVMQNFDRQGIDSERFQVVLTQASLGAVATRCLDESRYALRKRKAQLTFTVADALTVQADVTRLEVVLDNLLSNALKAMPSGGSLSVTGGRDAEEVWLEIVNSGGPIAPDRARRIFQVQSPNPHDPTSTGIGLWICREYLTVMGAAIALIRNDEQVGFRLSFPLMQNAAPQREAASREEA